MNKARISQQQIAKDLGISQTLVSWVLNGRRKGVSEESFRLIWEHARSKGYRPRGMASEFLQDTAKMESVGFVLRTGLQLYNQNPFFGHVQHGLHDYLNEHGASLVFLGVENSIDVEKLGKLHAGTQSLRGLVVMGEVARPFLHALKKLELRIVSVSAQFPGLCHSVGSNEVQSADLIVQHLVDLGHRHFAWLGGNRGMQRAKGRFEAVIDALHQHNLAIDPHFCIDTDGAGRPEGRRVAELILKAISGRQPPTAWIIFNGTMARGAADYLLQQGIRIPEDVSLATFDRTRLCEEDHPSLTGASAPPELIGRVAGEILLQSDSTDGGRFSDTVLPSGLMVGESTGTPSQKKPAPCKNIAPAGNFASFYGAGTPDRV